MLDRFMSKVEESGEPYGLRGKCWNWTGAIASTGYGAIKIEGRAETTHRVSYEWFYGSILPGLEIDHLCRNRKCCNPLHLEAVTRKVNVDRSPIHGGQPQDFCKKGHPMSGSNLYVKPNGDRSCRHCRREHGTVWKRTYRAQGRDRSRKNYSGA